MITTKEFITEVTAVAIISSIFIVLKEWIGLVNTVIILAVFAVAELRQGE